MTSLGALFDWFAADREFAAAEGRRDHMDARLRALPREEIHLFVKSIDNSNVSCLVDKKEWAANAIAVSSALLASLLIIALLFPSTYSLVLGYHIEQLKQDRAALINDLRELRSVEAALKSTSQLEEYAGERFQAPPASAIVFAPPAKAAVASLERH